MRRSAVGPREEGDIAERVEAGLQAGLDTLGYIAFLAGSNSAAPHITMVVASAFSVVAVLLARLIVDEPVSKMQWAAIVLIAGGTAVLSAT